MKPSPQVAVVVVSYNTRDVLVSCLASVIESTRSPNIEIVVVDNASTDGSLETVRQIYPQVMTIANPTNLGFGVACNQAIRVTTAPFILLLNSDATITPQCFEAPQVSSPAREGGEPSSEISEAREGPAQKLSHLRRSGNQPLPLPRPPRSAGPATTYRSFGPKSSN